MNSSSPKKVTETAYSMMTVSLNGLFSCSMAWRFPFIKKIFYHIELDSPSGTLV